MKTTVKVEIETARAMHCSRDCQFSVNHGTLCFLFGQPLKPPSGMLWAERCAKCLNAEVKE